MYKLVLSPIYRPLIRNISEFIIPINDCCYPPVKRRIVIDPNKCTLKDKGLVLGVYCNNQTFGERGTLTKTAEKYNILVKNRLWELLKLAPIPKLGEVRVYYDLAPQFDKKYGFVAVAGLGSNCEKYNDNEKLEEGREAVRIASAVGAHALQQLRASSIGIESFNGNTEAAIEGATLAVWNFHKYRKVNLEDVFWTPKLEPYDEYDVTEWESGKLQGLSQNLVRFLQEEPSNLLNPSKFSEHAVHLLTNLDIDVKVKTKSWAKTQEMGGFVSISESSVKPPLFVELHYRGTKENTRPYVLVGKGVTFNTGGLDLKSPEQLRYMKGEMSGAACVLSAVRAAALLKLPVNIVGVMPMCELMTSGRNLKYGDVYTTGLAKESTSIELRKPGFADRILIADSIKYARSIFSPKMILDVGTMSEQTLPMLGGAACACYSNDRTLQDKLVRAASWTGDRLWPMPLWNHYQDRLKTRNAKMANAGPNVNGDSPTCAAFLRNFACDCAWVHLDTYNVGYTKGVDIPYLHRGMTGRPVRTIIEYLKRASKEKEIIC